MACPITTSQHSRDISFRISPSHQNSARKERAIHLQAIRKRLDISDGAKMTYFELLDYDYADAQKGESKGYVWPSVATLASARGKTERTIRDHLQELVRAGLITRLRRQYTSSVFCLKKPLGRHTEGNKGTHDHAGDTPNSNSSRTANNRRSDMRRFPAEARAKSFLHKPNPERQKTAVVYIRKETTRTKKLQQEQFVVVNILEKLRIAQTKAEELASQFPVSYIESKIALLERQLTHADFGKRILNPAAWLIAAIEKDYHIPKLEQNQCPPPHKPTARHIELDHERGICIISDALTEPLEEGSDELNGPQATATTVTAERW